MNARSDEGLLDAWTRVLDRLEDDVVRAERALAEDAVLQVDPWQPPPLPGPVPAPLRKRAAALVLRQETTLDDLHARLGVTHRARALAERVGRVSTRTSDRPVYVDVNA